MNKKKLAILLQCFDEELMRLGVDKTEAFKITNRALSNARKKIER